MPFTDSLPAASAYLALGHTLTECDPISVVQMPDGSEFVTFNFQPDGQDSRFDRQMILNAVKTTPDAASKFDDFLQANYPELVADWHSALAAAAARGARHAQALIALSDSAPCMIAVQRGSETLFINSDATQAQIEQLSKL